MGETAELLTFYEEYWYKYMKLLFYLKQIIAETNNEDARKSQLVNSMEECYIKSTDKIGNLLCWNYMYEPVRVQESN